MYKLYIDDSIVWMNSTPEVGVYSGKIELKANSTQSLELSLASNSSIYDSFKPLISKIDIYQDDEKDPIFEGRPISDKIDFYGNKTVICEGTLGYLYDSVQYPKDYTGMTIEAILKGLIATHNEQVEPYKQFVVGNITVIDKTDSKSYDGSGRRDDDDSDPFYYYETDKNKGGLDKQTELVTKYESTFDAINNLLINNLSGYLVVRIQNGTKYLDYLKDYMPTEGQTIMFGSNLLDYSSTLDYGSFCTGIIPVGGTDDSLRTSKYADDVYQQESTSLESELNKITIESVNNGSKILWNDEAVKNFGRIVKSVSFDTTDVNKLLEKGKKYLNQTQWENLTLECKIFDLHFTDANVTPLHHMRMVKVISQPHGLNKLMPISEMSIDLLDPSQDTVTLGATYNSLTGELANTESTVSGHNSSINNINTTISNNNNTYWTNITKTDRDIIAEAHARENSDSSMQKAYDAKFEITAQQISAEVSARETADGQVRTDMTTKISQTAKEIRQEASDNVNNLNTKISQTAKEIRQEASDNVNNLNTKISQNAESITAEATARKTSEDNITKDYTSKIQQNANSISAEVTARTNAIDGLSNTVTSHWNQTPSSFSLGFDGSNNLTISHNTKDGTTYTDASVNLSSLKLSANNIDFSATKSLYLSSSSTNGRSGMGVSNGILYIYGQQVILEPNDQSISLSIANGTVNIAGMIVADTVNAGIGSFTGKVTAEDFIAQASIKSNDDISSSTVHCSDLYITGGGPQNIHLGNEHTVCTREWVLGSNYDGTQTSAISYFDSRYVKSSDISTNYVKKSTYDTYVSEHKYTNTQYDNKKATKSTTIEGATTYTTYAQLETRKNELVEGVKKLRAQVKAGCKKGTEPVY